MKTLPAEKNARLQNIDIFYGPLILVNKSNPIAYTTEVPMASIAPNIQLEKQAARLLEETLQKIKAGGKIVPVSGYRNQQEQQAILASAIAEHGEAYAKKYVALPGCSEHQTGLAIDVGKSGENIDFITPEFPYHGIFQSFRKEAVRHGFIQRYAKGKEHITGIGHEPWHFRYVGVPHAQFITGSGMALEEYISWVRGHVFGKNPYNCCLDGRHYQISFLSAANHSLEIALPNCPYTISGNNIDGFIVTVWGGKNDK